MTRGQASALVKLAMDAPNVKYAAMHHPLRPWRASTWWVVSVNFWRADGSECGSNDENYTYARRFIETQGEAVFGNGVMSMEVA